MTSLEALSRRREVVAALLVNDSRILVAKRKASDSHPSVWEFPGGKVEQGESPAEALKREIKEELGMDIQVLERIESRDYVTPRGQPIRLSLYATQALSSEFSLNEHEEARWVQFHELQQVEFLPGNQQFLPAIEKWWKESQ